MPPGTSGRAPTLKELEEFVRGGDLRSILRRGDSELDRTALARIFTIVRPYWPMALLMVALLLAGTLYVLVVAPVRRLRR